MSSGLTLGVARATLPSSAFPPGAAATAALAAPHVNAASSWLMSQGRWRGSVRKVAFPVFDNMVTAPRNVLTILGGAIQGEGDNASCAWMYDVRNEFYQFLPGGFGLITSPCGASDFTSQGDGFVTFRDLPSAGKLKIYNTSSEGACQLHVRGLSGGQKVYTHNGCNRIEGENITFPTGPGATKLSETTFDAGPLYALNKSVSNGVLLVYHVASDLTETLIGRYEPGERVANYRRYHVPRRTNDSGIVVALCKLRHVDVACDNDEIVPGNLTALELAMMAVNFRRKAEMDRAREYMGMAVDELNSELEEWDAEASLGSFTIDPVCGLGGVENLV